MKLIAAVDSNWAIGKGNKLLTSIPEDMKFFRQTTTGHVVVMGRKTLESFPNGAPLKNRVNIVLTSDRNYSAGDAIIVHDLDQLTEELKKYDTNEVYVIGGESIYRQLYNLCDTAYITYMDYAFDADAHFPNLDADPAWELVSESEEHTCFDLIYFFRTYEKK